MFKLEVKIPAYNPDGSPKFTKSGNPKETTVYAPPPAVQLELDPASVNGARFRQGPNIWSLDGFVYAVEGHRKRAKILEADQKRLDALKKPSPLRPRSSDPAPSYAYYVSHKPSENRVVIHQSGCDSARSAPAHVGDRKRLTRWSGHHSLNEAKAYAERLDHYGADICRKCLGEYAPRGGTR